MSATDSRQQFGKAVATWFERNDWPQKICELWSQAAENGEKGPWASQISQVMHNRVDPRTAFFSALGAFNAAVAERDLMTVRKNDAMTYDRLVAGEPFVLENGAPANGTDFFAMFTGDALIPSQYLKKLGLDQDDIEAIWERCHKALEYFSLETCRSRQDVLQELDHRLFSKRGEFGQAMKRAALGLGLPAPEDLQRFHENGECPDGCPLLLELEAMLREASRDCDLVRQLNQEVIDRVENAGVV